jgi:hypothetical protein
VPDDGLDSVATAVLLLLHVPPGVVSPKVVDVPWHTLKMPVIAEGRPLIVTVTICVQPDPNEYVITDVPATAPHTVPKPVTVIDGLLLVHVPPPAPSISDVQLSTHTCSTPPIGVGAVFTVTVVVAVQPAAVV